MSTNVNSNDINNFFISKFHTNKISIDDLKSLGINVNDAKKADKNEDLDIDVREIVDSDLYEEFASIIIAEHEKGNVEVDEEKEKEEETKVKDKNGTGV